MNDQPKEMTMKTKLLVAALALISAVAFAEPVSLGAVSRKTHGTSGTFDIPLPGVEPRSGQHRIVFTFDRAIVAAECYLVEGGGTVAAAQISGREVTCPVTVPYNGLYVSINAVVQDAAGGYGEDIARVGLLHCDVNGSGAVTVSDLARVRSQIAQPLTVANFRHDVNASGAITVSDQAIVQSRIATGLPLE